MSGKPWYFGFGERGPDWIIDLVVTPAGADRLRELTASLPLAGFVRYDAKGVRGAISDDIGDHLWFIDRHSFPAFAARHDQGVRSNSWIFHFIAVEGQVVRIERGHGGYDSDEPAEQTACETELIAAVLDDEELELVRWAVYPSGDGCEAQDVAEGSTRGELASYLGVIA